MLTFILLWTGIAFIAAAVLIAIVLHVAGGE